MKRFLAIFLLTAGCASSSSFTINVTGSGPFSGSILVIRAGRSEQRSVDGTGPSSYSEKGTLVSVSFSEEADQPNPGRGHAHVRASGRQTQASGPRPPPKTAGEEALFEFAQAFDGHEHWGEDAIRCFCEWEEHFLRSGELPEGPADLRAARGHSPSTVA